MQPEMQSVGICCCETYVKASFFSGFVLFGLNILQFMLSINLGLADFLQQDDFGPSKTSFAILGCLVIGLLMAFFLMAGAYGDGRRSSIPLLATIILAIVQSGVYLGLTVPIINDFPVIDNKIWIASCIGMAIANFWTIFVAFKAKKEISRIAGYEEIA